MITVRFDPPTRISRQAVLRERFGNDRIDMASGATLTLSGEVTLGTEVVFTGNTVLGAGTSVGNGSQLTDVVIGADNRIRPYSILTNLRAGNRNLFGPFAFLRDGCAVENDCILGAHVEATRSHFASGVKVSHHAFIGDADIGEGTIVGAGVVFCNYDGRRHQVATVGAGVALGSGALLVSPLTIGDRALIAAGSTVVRDVGPGVRFIQKRETSGR